MSTSQSLAPLLCTDLYLSATAAEKRFTYFPFPLIFNHRSYGKFQNCGHIWEFSNFQTLLLLCDADLGFFVFLLLVSSIIELLIPIARALVLFYYDPNSTEMAGIYCTFLG